MGTKAKRRPTTKKSKKKAAPRSGQKSGQTVQTRQARTEIEYLELLIQFDERNIDGSGSSLDQLFTKQRDRTRAKIEALKAAG